MLAETIREIAQLQPQYSSENTEAMQRRGFLIRRVLPNELAEFQDRFRGKLGAFGDSIAFEGRDGIGRKTPAPWVRIFSKELSPSATTGFYMVIHFSVDGSLCFVTVGCASTTWDSERGDLVKSSDEDIQRKVDWARRVVREAAIDYSSFQDSIDIGSTLSLPRSFEKATAFCQAFSVAEITDDSLLVSIDGSMSLLSAIYDAYSNLEDLSVAERGKIALEAVVNPTKKNPASRQGYGLSTSERKAVEAHAMDLVRDFLVGLGYSVTDVSSTASFDYLATKEDEEKKVEVKGTTSPAADAILMTANEVRLHTDNHEQTALAIVSGIAFVRRGEEAECAGGEIEYRDPSAIDGWSKEPTVYLIRRQE